MINLTGIYVMWLRDMKLFFRSPSRIIGQFTMPVLLIVSLGFGFSTMVLPGMPKDMSYIKFLIPGMIAMSTLFTGTFMGMAVLWDRQYGFLKEIMVAPVSRLSIVIGRMLGGSTTAIFQGAVIIAFSFIFGIEMTSVLSFVLAFVFMTLICLTFCSIGLSFASNMKDEQGFGLIMNFLVMPLLFFSGAFFPIQNLPSAVSWLTYIDPLTYGVDGMRYAMLGASAMPVELDLLVLSAITLVLILLSAFFFENSESV